MNNTKEHSEQQNLFTTTYQVIYQKGKLIDATTGKEILLKEGTNFQLQVDNSQVLEKIEEQHQKPKELSIIKKDSKLTFRIKDYDFVLELQEDLKLLTASGKKTKLAPVQCVVFEMSKKGETQSQEFEPITADSLNRAYTETYNRYYKEGANNRYVYDTFKWEGNPLKLYKETWEQDLKNSKTVIDEI